MCWCVQNGCFFFRITNPFPQQAMRGRADSVQAGIEGGRPSPPSFFKEPTWATARSLHIYLTEIISEQVSPTFDDKVLQLKQQQLKSLITNLQVSLLFRLLPCSRLSVRTVRLFVHTSVFFLIQCLIVCMSFAFQISSLLYLRMSNRQDNIVLFEPINNHKKGPE